MKNKEQQLEDKIKKIKEGCGFQNSYKQICGKTPKKKTDKRDKYLIYLCMRCMSKMGIIKRQINLIQEGKKLKEDEDLKILEEMQKQNVFYLNKAVEMKEDLKRKEALIKVWKAVIDYTKELTSKIKEKDEK
jgi:hypothetical protein